MNIFLLLWVTDVDSEGFIQFPKQGAIRLESLFQILVC